MSVFREKGSPFWRYDFQVGGHRFFGSTKSRNKREAQEIERSERETAKRHVAQVRAAATSLRLDDVAGRYWSEVGQHHAGKRNTERQLGYLIDFFGKDKLLTEVTDDDLTRLVAWRRGHRARNGALISAYTVNDTTEQLKKLFIRAKAWGVVFDREPQWRKHWLAEPQERVRELVGDEAERLEAATRADYAPFFGFVRASGLRQRECLLQWSEVDWGARQIRKRGKGDRLVTVPITPTIREILWPLRGHHPEHVFTYVAERSRDGRVQGQRYPLTYSGVQIAWRRLRKRAGVTGFRFHDFRHDLGSKLLRTTGNLKLVQRALNHSRIETTMRYAHVLDDEVADALERVQKSQNGPQNSQPIRNLKGKSA
ncbi:MAG: site-specific integrase [Xanthobacteraceae bacterium]